MLRTRISMAALAIAAALMACAPIEVSTNRLPVARAGEDQTVLLGTTVVIDGSGSVDGDADPLTYQWSLAVLPANSKAELKRDDAAPHLVSLTPDRPGSFGVRLIVNDGKVDSGASTVVITVPAADQAPVAVTGPDQTVALGALVTLDGRGSRDPESSTLTYQWTISSRPGASAAVLSNANTAQPTFVTDSVGVYGVKLVVSDGQSSSAPAVTLVNVTGTNAAPTAEAGPNKFAVTAQTVVTLDGSGTDADGGTLYYTWRFDTRPAGSSAALNDPASPTPTFVPDVTGAYRLLLSVDDGQNITRDSVEVFAARECCFDLVSGTPQSAVVATTLTSPFTVKVTNEYGLGVAGVPINWSIVQGNGSLSGTTFTTDSNGIAQTSLTLGTVAGANQVIASCGACTADPTPTVTFEATGNHGPPYAVEVGQPGVNVQVPGPTSFSFRVVDRYRNLATTDSQTQFTVKAGGSAVISNSTTGSIVAGAGTNSALVQVAGGVIALEATDAVAETVNFDAIDSQANGLLYPSGNFSGTTPLQGNLCNGGVQTQTFTLNGPFPAPIGSATLTVFGRGDYGDPGESVQVYVESTAGTDYGTALAFAGECSSLYGATNFTIPLAALQSYLADGVFKADLAASASVGCFCTANEARVALSYPANAGTSATFSP